MSLRARLYVPYRVGIAALELVGVTLITFLLSRASGNPLTLYIEATTPVSQYPIIIAEHHLNAPVYVQYYYYLIQLFHGDWGLSKVTGLTVTQSIGALLPWTLELVIAAAVVAFVVGIPLGLYLGWKGSGKTSGLIRLVSYATTSIPQLVFGVLLIFLFFYYPNVYGLPYLPSSGGISSAVAAAHPVATITGLPLLDSLITGNFAYFSNSLAHLIMPAITLSLFPMGYIINTVSAKTRALLGDDFILYLRSTGTPDREIVLKHLLRHNLAYLLTLAGLLVGTLMGSTVVVETIFGWPGLGQWAADSILTNDLAGTLGFTIVVAVAFIATSLIADLAYPVIDPRRAK